jgi:SAM-dependent methyltransferase
LPDPESIEQPKTSKHYSFAVYEDVDTAENFDLLRFGGEVGALFRDHQEKLLEQMIPDVEGMPILDVGAGTGRAAIPLRKRGADVTAADASYPMLRVCREKAWLQGFPLHYARTDACNLPFPDGSFGIVISLRLLMHVTDWRRMLSELCRVSFGSVVVDFPPRCGFAGLAPLVHPLNKLRNKNYQPYRVFSIGEVVHSFEDNGFSPVRCERKFVLPYGFHRFIGSAAFTRRAEDFLARCGMADIFGAPVTMMASRKNRS